MWFESYQRRRHPTLLFWFLQIRDRNDIIHLKLDKQDYDERWLHVPIQRDKIRFYSQIDEDLNLEFENAYVTDFRENGDFFAFGFTHLELLTLDKRAFYIIAIEIATIFNGQISEDDKKTWITIENSRKKHKDILSLTFEEANEMSLEEIQTIDAIDDPIWKELDRAEEYIRIHGEVELDDDEGR